MENDYKNPFWATMNAILPAQEFKIVQQVTRLNLSEVIPLFKVKIAPLLALYSVKFEESVREYRRFLALKVITKDYKSPFVLSPGSIVDQLWHAHILCTEHYSMCCKNLGDGEFIHHDPINFMDCRDKRIIATELFYRVIFGQNISRNPVWYIRQTESSMDLAGCPDPDSEEEAC